MTFVAFHGALRINTNPLNPALGVVQTINLALDHPDNVGGLRPFEWIKIVHNMICDYQLTEQVSQSSTRRRSMKGLGVRMRWAIEFSMFPVKPQEWYGSLGSSTSSAMDDPMQNIFNALGVGQSGFNDGISKYLWFTPNYQWINPVEQWFRVVPDGQPTFKYPAKTYSTVFGINLMSERNFKSINWRYYRRGFQYAGAGTVSVPGASTTMTGVLTTFLTDFISGDRVRLPSGGYVTVASVQSDTQLTLTNLAFIPSTIYTVDQASMPTWAIPNYTVVGFGPASGWGISPWGDNWGQ